jgi:hypothetical protein
MPASELTERVAELIAKAEELVPEGLRPHLRALQTRLREPLRVAVVGRVKAGKSTLVNALLGDRVAPTDVSECTRVVTWFHYGRPERLVVRLKTGGELDVQLTPDGRLPAELPAPVEEVASLNAYLVNDALRSMTLIDTPGLSSVHGEYSASTERLLATSEDTAAAASAADAVVFLLNQPVMKDEFDALTRFSTNGENRQGSAATALGVLTRADQLSEERRDAWQVAIDLAGQYAGTFRDQLATVVPVMGLIAEAAETATLTEPDAKELARLAAMEPKQLGRLLWSVDRFTSSDAPVPSEARQRLLEMLDLYGIERGVDLVRRGGAAGAFALRRELSSLSGIADVKRVLSSFFAEQDHVLKARSALEALHRISFVVDRRSTSASQLDLREEVERLRLDPVMHPIAELEVWHDVCTGRLAMPTALADEMRRMFAPGGAATKLGADGQGPEALRELAKDGMIRWRTFMNTEASPAQGRACRVMTRSYQLLWASLE